MTTGASQIDSLLDELRENSRQAERMFDSHMPRHLERPAGTRRWSAVECIGHLNLANRAHLAILDSAIEELCEKKILGGGPYRLSLNARFLKYWLEPPSRWHFSASAEFQPVGIRDAAGALEEFRTIGRALEEKLDSARGFALDRVKLRSPLAQKPKCNIYSAFVLITVHNRRHLWQAEQALGAAIPG